MAKWQIFRFLKNAYLRQVFRLLYIVCDFSVPFLEKEEQLFLIVVFRSKIYSLD